MKFLVRIKMKDLWWFVEILSPVIDSGGPVQCYCWYSQCSLQTSTETKLAPGFMVQVYRECTICYHVFLVINFFILMNINNSAEVFLIHIHDLFLIHFYFLNHLIWIVHVK